MYDPFDILLRAGMDFVRKRGVPPETVRLPLDVAESLCKCKHAGVPKGSGKTGIAALIAFGIAGMKVVIDEDPEALILFA